MPPLLRSKLAKGYPHIAIERPTAGVPEDRYLLCRYNIARNRGSFSESPADGFLRDGMGLPTARLPSEKAAMLRAHRGTCIEVLFSHAVPIPPTATVWTFNAHEADMARAALGRLGSAWGVRCRHPEPPYALDPQTQIASESYLSLSVQRPEWRGTPLEFDR